MKAPHLYHYSNSSAYELIVNELLIITYIYTYIHTSLHACGIGLQDLMIIQWPPRTHTQSEFNLFLFRNVFLMLNNNIKKKQ